MSVTCRDLSRQELTSVVHAFRGPLHKRSRALFLLGVATGFRISELLSLNLGDVIDPAGEIVPAISIARKNLKGGRSSNSRVRSRTLPLCQAVRQALSDWIAQYQLLGNIAAADPIFGTAGGKRISRHHARKILKAGYRRAGLTGPGLATHTMRKTFAMLTHEDLLNQLASGQHVNIMLEMQSAMGHVNVDSTTKYLPRTHSHAAAAIASVGSLLDTMAQNQQTVQTQE